jgi:hypothetical protein
MTRHQLAGWMGLAGIAIALTIGAVLWESRTLSSAADIKRIQYKVIEVTGDVPTLQAALDTYGNAGWDLVAVAFGDIQAPKLILKKSE